MLSVYDRQTYLLTVWIIETTSVFNKFSFFVVVWKYNDYIWASMVFIIWIIYYLTIRTGGVVDSNHPRSIVFRICKLDNLYLNFRWKKNSFLMVQSLKKGLKILSPNFSFEYLPFFRNELPLPEHTFLPYLDDK